MTLEKKIRKAIKKGTGFYGLGLLPIKKNGSIDWTLWKAMAEEAENK